MDKIFRFARFEADRDRHELRQGSRRIKLERIPTDLLFLLLEKSGSVVTREEIEARLWGSDLFLDSERSINTAIRKIRRALRDDARHPQLIETVVGKGYRFIGALTYSDERRSQAALLHDSDGALPQSTNSHEIRLTEFVIEINAGTPVLTCDMVRGNYVIGRLPLAQLDFPPDMRLPLKAEDRMLMKLLSVKVAVTAQATQALQAFCIRVLQAGIRMKGADFSLAPDATAERQPLSASGADLLSTKKSHSAGAD